MSILTFLNALAGNRPELVEEYFSASLRDLSLDYVDLYLLHVPFAFRHTPGDLHPRNPDGSMQVDLETDLIALWKVSRINCYTF